MEIVIIGSGPAGVSVAETLRQNEYQGQITMLSSEPFPPYAPPAMIEYFMTGQDAHLWKWQDIPQRFDIDYRAGTRVVEVVPGDHLIRLANGKTLNYDRLVIASGSRLYTPLSNADKPGIYNFKSLSAAKNLVEAVRRGRAVDVIIVGAGFIGVEIALLLRHMGTRIILLEMSEQIMPRRLAPETAEIVRKSMIKQGIDVRLNTKALRFLGDPRAEAVELESGEILKANHIIAATGIKPNTEFLDGSGIQKNWGVCVDAYLRTNAPDVYAAGDVAETPNRVTGKHDMHAIFPNAVTQGRLVAYNLLEWNIPYEGAENMNSLKHLGIPVVAAGEIEGEQLGVRRDDMLRRLYLQDNHIVGFQLVGNIRGAGIFRALMNKKVEVGPIKERLIAPGFGIGYIPDQNLFSNSGKYPIL